MFKHVWHVSGMLIVLIFCCIYEQCNGRSSSSTVTTYQHLNGINVKANNMPTIIYGGDEGDNNENSLENEQKENAAQASTTQAQQIDGGGTSSSTGIWKDFSLIYRIYQQCSNENLSVCLKVKLLTNLEKVLRTSKTLRLIDGIQFIRSGEDNSGELNMNYVSTKVPSEADIMANLPRSLDARESVLNNLIFKKLVGFLRDHTLQVKFPDVRSVHDVEESFAGRGKKKDKKGGGAYIMIPLLLGGTFVPIAYGALAMLAGKALIVSKLALVLASIIGIKKLLGGGGGKEQHEVVVSGGHSGWGRDIDLAYSGWKPAAKDTQKFK